MITPSFSLTATERVLPKLALDFTTATLDPRVTFTRSGNTATYTNSSGVITAINADLPRFDYNPTTLICQGLLIEGARTNLLLNSLIDGTSLSTQSVTTSATVYTLSFYGTGSIDLSGTATATVAGTNVYPTRTTYTFTPTAGSLTLTVTGTVQYAQLEAGAFATSFIPTAGSSVTRNADVAAMTGTNFSDWYNASEGTFEVDFNPYYVGGAGIQQSILSVSDGTVNNTMDIYKRNNADTSTRLNVVVSTVSQVFLNAGVLTTGNNKIAMAYKLDNYAFCKNAATVLTDSAATVPTVDRLAIGTDSQTNAFALEGYLQRLKYWPQRLINAEVRAFSK